MIEAMFREFDGGISMRRFLLAAAMFATMSCARAADMPDYLRGSFVPAPVMNWRGFYLGGQGAYGSSDETLLGSGVNAILLQNLLAGNVLAGAGLTAPTASGKTSARAPGYGAFTGYNWQWDDVVAGVEMSYLHGNFGGSVSAIRPFVSGALSDGNFHAGNVTSTTAIAITDYATFRGRAGYAFSCFLPYAFAGIALGNANTSNSVKVQDSISAVANGPFTILPPLGAADVTNSRLIYGYSAGVGIDINLIGGLFMRAEWEYLRFTAQVDTTINTVRAGLGYKF
jgi:outer membrane immunogenic protein